jgi:hypothetical protein
MIQNYRSPRIGGMALRVVRTFSGQMVSHLQNRSWLLLIGTMSFVVGNSVIWHS